MNTPEPITAISVSVSPLSVQGRFSFEDDAISGGAALVSRMEPGRYQKENSSRTWLHSGAFFFSVYAISSA